MTVFGEGARVVKFENISVEFVRMNGIGQKVIPVFRDVPWLHTLEMNRNDLIYIGVEKISETG